MFSFCISKTPPRQASLSDLFQTICSHWIGIAEQGKLSKAKCHIFTATRRYTILAKQGGGGWIWRREGWDTHWMVGVMSKCAAGMNGKEICFASSCHTFPYYNARANARSIARSQRKMQLTCCRSGQCSHPGVELKSFLSYFTGCCLGTSSPLSAKVIEGYRSRCLRKESAQIIATSHDVTIELRPNFLN